MIVVFGAYLAFIRSTSADPVSVPMAASVGPVPSRFSFDAASAVGWQQGGTNATSMAVFHKYDCFASADLKPGKVDVAAELDKSQTPLTGSGYTVTPGPVQTLNLRTEAGAEQYQLYQYAVSGAGSLGAVKGGQAYGYVQLASNYVKLESHCDTAGQLTTTTQALQAITLNTMN